MIVPKFYGTIKLGKLEMNAGEQDLINSYLLQFKEGQEIETTIKKKYKKRSSGQQGETTNFNGYFWKIITMIATDIGEYGEEGVKRTEKTVLIKVGHIEVDKFGQTITKSTSILSGGEFAELCAKVRMWSSEFLGLYLPEPHEAEWER